MKTIKTKILKSAVYILLVFLTLSCSNDKPNLIIDKLRNENDSLVVKVNEQEEVIISLFVKLNQIEELVESNQYSNIKIKQIEDLLNEKKDYKMLSEEIKTMIEDYFLVINTKEEHIHFLEKKYATVKDSLESIIRVKENIISIEEQKINNLRSEYEKIKESLLVLNQEYEKNIDDLKKTQTNIKLDSSLISNCKTEVQDNDADKAPSNVNKMHLAVIVFFVLWLGGGLILYMGRDYIFTFYRSTKLILAILALGLFLLIIIYGVFMLYNTPKNSNNFIEYMNSFEMEVRDVEESCSNENY
jgi:hypothetical protein